MEDFRNIVRRHRQFVSYTSIVGTFRYKGAYDLFIQLRNWTELQVHISNEIRKSHLNPLSYKN